MPTFVWKEPGSERRYRTEKEDGKENKKHGKGK